MATMKKLAELNSFVSKFNSLWATGSNASLTFESNAGQAYVTLRLCLGEHPRKLDDPATGVLKKHLSPSKLRRRERRAAERLSAENIKSADVIEKSDIVEKAGSDSITIANSVKDDVTETMNTMNYYDVEEISCVKTRNSEKKPANQDAILAERRSLWAPSYVDKGSIKCANIERVNLEDHQDREATKKPDNENPSSNLKSYLNTLT